MKENKGTIKRREINADNLALVKKEQPQLSELEARLYAARNAIEPKTSLTDILKHSMTDLDVGAKRLYEAIKKRLKIVVVADYDCDGATSCALMVKGLSQLGANIDYVVPDRMIHGYGISPSVVDLARQYHSDAKVLVTVDNGIMGHEGITYAQNLGLDVIVTDHHLPGESLPDASAVINPNRNDCSSGLGKLAGVGVALWVVLSVRGLYLRDGGNPPKMSSLLGLLALGTVADLVPLDVNNRALINAGFSMLRKGDGPLGVRALMNQVGINSNYLVSSDIGFGMAPRINAAGRLEDMRQGIDLLLTDDRYKAQKLAAGLCEVNEKRKEIQKQATEQAQDDLKEALSQIDDDQADQYTIVKANSAWHPGIIGLVASRLKEIYFKPTFVFSTEDGKVKGSGRSIPGFHLKDALEDVARLYPGVLLQFGGHAMAAGASLSGIDAIETFTKAFEEVAQKRINKETFNRVWLSDGALPALNTDEAFALLSHPWGQGFEAPAFDDYGQVVDIKNLGKDGKHWRIKAKLDSQKEPVELLLFNQPRPVAGTQTHFYIEPNLNTYNGNTKVQWIANVFQ